MLPRSAIRAAAESFWASAGGRTKFGTPANLERAVVQTLPLAIHYVAGLTTTDVELMLSGLGNFNCVARPSRPLRGCLVADVGMGLIFVDSEDLYEEQRLTVAHEVAHFILHYLNPRRDAVTGLGPGVAAVLDRTRSATRAELFSAAFRDLPIEPFRHAMARNGSSATGTAAVMEAEADDLGIELLAPWNLVRSMDQANTDAIASNFGVPRGIAERLAAMAARPRTGIGVAGLFGIR